MNETNKLVSPERMHYMYYCIIIEKQKKIKSVALAITCQSVENPVTF